MPGPVDGRADQARSRSTGEADATPLPHRAALAAAAIADGVPPDVADRLRLDHLGWRRRPLELPAERQAWTSDVGGMDPVELEAIAWSTIGADVTALASSRRLEPPGPAS